MIRLNQLAAIKTEMPCQYVAQKQPGLPFTMVFNMVALSAVLTWLQGGSAQQVLLSDIYLTAPSDHGTCTCSIQLLAHRSTSTTDSFEQSQVAQLSVVFVSFLTYLHTFRSSFPFAFLAELPSFFTSVTSCIEKNLMI